MGADFAGRKPAGSELVLQVSKPAAGESNELTVNSSSDSRVLLSLDFEPSEALSELVDDDLIFTFDDDAELVLRDCFAGPGEDYPNFMLADGSELDGGELYAVLSGSIKLYPEDGVPVASAPGGQLSGDFSESVQAELGSAPGSGMAGAVAPDEDLSLLVQVVLHNSGVS